MITPNIPQILYGGDYNPEQWPEDVWLDDMRLFSLAGVNTVSVNVFGWGRLQPAEDRYEFHWLDRIMDLLGEHGIQACLGTATVVYPSWMGRRYPDLQRVGFDGRKRKYGGRANFCPNSSSFRRFASELVRRIADRYKDHPALSAWHISNEYNGYCYCENCEAAFRRWLQARYGTVEEVNRAWNTSFWNHLYYDWEDIVSPTETTIYWGDTKSSYPSQTLDYMRFQSDSLLECFLMERDIVKRVTPHIPVTTNFMGFWKELDYRKWSQYVDVAAWDSYPSNDAPPHITAFWHDMMRGLRDGQPYMLMEQAPDRAQWRDYNPPKRPGVMRLQSYQAIARGADAVMFFQMRQSIGGGEKMHGGVIGHAGHEFTRTFREVAALGGELHRLGDALIDARTSAKAAILFDWENCWAVELCAGPSKDIRYFAQLLAYYKAFHDANIQVDIVHPDSDFAPYGLIVAPLLYMVREGLDKKLESYVAGGGQFVTTCFSGLVDEHDRVVTGGYPGKLRTLLGIRVDESDTLKPEQNNAMTWDGESYACGLLCDIVLADAADVVARYAEDYYAGEAAMTCNAYGRGKAWYVGTVPEPDAIAKLVHRLAAEADARPILDTPANVEVALRSKEGNEYIFVMNHNPGPCRITLSESYVELIGGERLAGEATLPGYGVWVLARSPIHPLRASGSKPNV
ncbi:beta-galactosidase [Paenibacillus sp.]|uniref:beta-galactosidase n=1 Tax=Paenibacillus sp. TaxID=58172 RepID=UPI002D3247DD|nr:beta-galactosidase [Paenibacillus sp.]HZG55613.1 beta-galactosidase [Paenibacillus sp.]